jgi:hypothetical protein
MTARAERDAEARVEPALGGVRGVYVYGILPFREELPDDLPAVGDGEAAVELASHGELSALISDLDVARPLGTPGDLLAHERVLDTVAADSTVLPMRFGSVVSTVEAVVDELLAPNHDHFEAVLCELAGLVQFTVRGRYAEGAHLREVVAEEADIEKLREFLRGIPEDAGYAERLRLGELVNRAVVKKRERDVDALITSVARHIVGAVPHAVAGEDDATDVAFLVDRERVPQFERALDELGQQWLGRISLRVIGPLAPYDFLPEA